jgi:predicted phosphodiesterase
MDVFQKVYKTKSRTDMVHLYAIGDVHVGAPNFDKPRFLKYINYIKADKNHKAVFLLGDILDLIMMRDIKRFTADNLDDETLTGSPKQIRKNLSNIAVAQAKRAMKLLDPIKEHILGAVKGNHEESVEKHSGINIHGLLCEELGIRDCGDVGMACLKIDRLNCGAGMLKVAFMHHAAGGRTAGAGNNSLARALNIFDANVVMQGHNHSPAVQRVVRIGAACSSKANGEPKLTRNECIGLNVGSFLLSYQEGVNDYAQAKLFNPKEQTLHRIKVRVHDQKPNPTTIEPKFSMAVEELHV